MSKTTPLKGTFVILIKRLFNSCCHLAFDFFFLLGPFVASTLVLYLFTDYNCLYIFFPFCIIIKLFRNVKF